MTETRPARLFFWDVIRLTDGRFKGRVFEKPLGAMDFELSQFTVTRSSYRDPASAIQGAWELMNEMEGLGHYFLGKDPNLS